MTKRSYIDADDFSPGYMARAMDRFPKQGREPWTNCQDYFRERHFLATFDLDDGVLAFD